VEKDDRYYRDLEIFKINFQSLEYTAQIIENGDGNHLNTAILTSNINKIIYGIRIFLSTSHQEILDKKNSRVLHILLGIQTLIGNMDNGIA
jgi:hypothetical protein